MPKSDVPLVALSSIAVRRGDFDEALRLCEEALEYQSNSVFAQLNHAEIFFIKKNWMKPNRNCAKLCNVSADSPHYRTAQSLLETVKLIPLNG